MQALGAPWESANKYKISALPDGRFAIKEHGQAGAWAPSHEDLKAMPPMLNAVEESGDCTRICFTLMGCSNLRPLTMHYLTPQVGALAVPGYSSCPVLSCWGRCVPRWQHASRRLATSHPQNQEMYRSERPFKCGAWCGCPLEMASRPAAPAARRPLPLPHALQALAHGGAHQLQADKQTLGHRA